MEIANGEIGAALKRLLAIRGSSSVSLAAEIFPVVLVGDAEETPHSGRRRFALVTIGSGFVALVNNQPRPFVVEFCNARSVAAANSIGQWLCPDYLPTGALSGPVPDTDTGFVEPVGTSAPVLFRTDNLAVPAAAYQIDERNSAVGIDVEFPIRCILRQNAAVMIAPAVAGNQIVATIVGSFDP